MPAPRPFPMPSEVPSVYLRPHRPLGGPFPFPLPTFSLALRGVSTNTPTFLDALRSIALPSTPPPPGAGEFNREFRDFIIPLWHVGRV